MPTLSQPWRGSAQPIHYLAARDTWHTAALVRSDSLGALPPYRHPRAIPGDRYHPSVIGSVQKRNIKRRKLLNDIVLTIVATIYAGDAWRVRCWERGIHQWAPISTAAQPGGRRD